MSSTRQPTEFWTLDPNLVKLLEPAAAATSLLKMPPAHKWSVFLAMQSSDRVMLMMVSSSLFIRASLPLPSPLPSKHHHSRYPFHVERDDFSLVCAGVAESHISMFWQELTETEQRLCISMLPEPERALACTFLGIDNWKSSASAPVAPRDDAPLYSQNHAPIRPQDHATLRAAAQGSAAAMGDDGHSRGGRMLPFKEVSASSRGIVPFEEAGVSSGSRGVAHNSHHHHHHHHPNAQYAGGDSESKASSKALSPNGHAPAPGEGRDSDVQWDVDMPGVTHMLSADFVRDDRFNMPHRGREVANSLEARLHGAEESNLDPTSGFGSPVFAHGKRVSCKPFSTS